jgi:hypothetical protein
MAAASDLFARANDTPSLLRITAEALAAGPGCMCLVSLVGDDGLEPYAIAHGRPAAQRRLRRIVADPAGIPADAFSRTVHRTCGPLRMPIGSAHVLRLWLPHAYWSYLERVRVQGVLAAPLARGGQVLGTLLLWRECEQATYAEADQAYVSALAGRLALDL